MTIDKTRTISNDAAEDHKHTDRSTRVKQI